MLLPLPVDDFLDMQMPRYDLIRYLCRSTDALKIYATNLCLYLCKYLKLQGEIL